jgi:hypothetical protein
MKSIYDIRRDNLRALIANRFGGSQTALARTVGLNQASFVSRLVTAREFTRKNIGNRLARRIEAALSLPPNSLDTSGEETPVDESELLFSMDDAPTPDDESAAAEPGCTESTPYP